MTTETTTTEQERWVVYRDSERGVVPGECVFDNLLEFSLVRRISVDGVPDTHAAAMRDPDNVLNVSAYPVVVKMLTDAGNYFGKPTGQPPLCPEEALADAIAEALSLVHPQPEGDKT